MESRCWEPCKHHTTLNVLLYCFSVHDRLLRIFEGADEEDCLRLLVGRLPSSKSGPLQVPQSRTIPVSPHYARLLAILARQRGFDGYLLNFECPLQGST